MLNDHDPLISGVYVISIEDTCNAHKVKVRTADNRCCSHCVGTVTLDASYTRLVREHSLEYTPGTRASLKTIDAYHFSGLYEARQRHS